MLKKTIDKRPSDEAIAGEEPSQEDGKLASSMKHVLVTGVAGFIGSCLTERLLALGFRVTGVDNLDDFYDPAIKRRNLSQIVNNGAFRFVEADIRDLTTLRQELRENYWAIAHFAARAGVRPSIQDPFVYQEVNVNGTQNLLELARERNVRQFVFASSSSVYGINPNVPWREDDCVLLPISPYASTKVSGELLGHVYSHLYGIRFIGLRQFTVYGPRQRPDLAIGKFARLMLEDRRIPFFGDGSTRRDYTFIDDVVSGIVSALSYTGSMYEVINIGNSRTVSLAELVRGLEDVLGCKAQLDERGTQPGDVPQTWANLSKAKALLSYAPRIEFHDGLRRFAEWLKAENARSNEKATPRESA
jgi:UDP-glucuronate 4-epimerase